MERRQLGAFSLLGSENDLCSGQGVPQTTLADLPPSRRSFLTVKCWSETCKHAHHSWPSVRPQPPDNRPGFHDESRRYCMRQVKEQERHEREMTWGARERIADLARPEDLTTATSSPLPAADRWDAFPGRLSRICR